MKKLDIEKLLHWTFWELLKQEETAFSRWHPSGNGSSWKLVLKYGAYGTVIDESKRHGQIGDQFGPEPRLPVNLGAPHPDSLEIEKRISGLPRAIGTLIIQHGKKETRPDWVSGPIKIYPTHPKVANEPIYEMKQGTQVKIIGKNIGKSRGASYYTEGSYCPLQWRPSAGDITHGRHEYRLWHNGLIRLVEQLTGTLTAHCPQMPIAPAAPWLEPATTSRILTSKKMFLTSSGESLTGY